MDGIETWIRLLARVLACKAYHFPKQHPERYGQTVPQREQTP